MREESEVDVLFACGSHAKKRVCIPRFHSSTGCVHRPPRLLFTIHSERLMTQRCFTLQAARDSSEQQARERMVA